ncbi:hypothetical protein KIL84_007967 [Mauremys mutica]|uniref:Uncharacterized protein n=1 Tax=Mauremys mutica TaxID=74926 RepID=A0A9D4AW49_9SAUR|nr:hypothetical protein KIL84_007967 [Mauremys mutica]
MAKLALVYSMAKYRAPILGRSLHMDLIHIQLNAPMRLVTGTLKSTPLPVLANILLLTIWQEMAMLHKYKKAFTNHKLLLRDIIVHLPYTRLKSCQPFWVAGDTLLSSISTQKIPGGYNEQVLM